MTDLLETAIAAHGGWKRWQELTTLTVHASVGGGIWPLKGWNGVHADLKCVVDTVKPHVDIAPFIRPTQHGVWEPLRTRIVDNDAKALEEQSNPRNTFAGHAVTTHWDALQMLYFSGYALWTYMTAPFIFKLPGFKVEEIQPWDEDGEVWRRLKVVFPEAVPSHSKEQTFYFGPDGLLRRHDYSVEIMGGTTSAHYTGEPKPFGGLVFPTKRRVYTAGPDNRPLLDRVAVSIDILDVTAQ